jgi:predicted site-specific integrase-resolvase
MTRRALERGRGFLLGVEMHVLLKPVELAKALRVSPAVISRWTKAGTITPAINEGKVIRFDEAKVRESLQERATKGRR